MSGFRQLASRTYAYIWLRFYVKNFWLVYEALLKVRRVVWILWEAFLVILFPKYIILLLYVFFNYFILFIFLVSLLVLIFLDRVVDLLLIE